MEQLRFKFGKLTHSSQGGLFLRCTPGNPQLPKGWGGRGFKSKTGCGDGACGHIDPTCATTLSALGAQPQATAKCGPKSAVEAMPPGVKVCKDTSLLQEQHMRTACKCYLIVEIISTALA